MFKRGDIKKFFEPSFFKIAIAVIAVAVVVIGDYVLPLSAFAQASDAIAWPARKLAHLLMTPLQGIYEKDIAFCRQMPDMEAVVQCLDASIWLKFLIAVRVLVLFFVFIEGYLFGCSLKKIFKL